MLRQGRAGHAVLPAGVGPLWPDDAAQVGGYPLLGRIGAGGMGVVYLGVAANGFYCAIKVIRAEYAADPVFRARFTREIELMSRVRAASVAPVVDADPRDLRPWLVTPYVPGPTLHTYVRDVGPLNAGRLQTIALGVAEALAAIHAVGVVHRDLKPANVILSPDGPRVLDFGIARAADETAITRTGILTGSPGWISPEQYRGEEPGPAADVFALGALIAYAASGRPPFGTGSTEVVAFRVLQHDPDIRGVPEALRTLTLQALAKSPAERPSATAMISQLVAGWGGGTGSADQPTLILGGLLASEWDGAEFNPSASPALPAPAAPGRSRWRRKVLLAPVLAMIVALAAVITAGLHRWVISPAVGGPAGSAAPPVAGPQAAPSAAAYGTAPWPSLDLLTGLGCFGCGGSPTVVDRLTTDGRPSRLVLIGGLVPGANVEQLKMFLLNAADNSELWRSSDQLAVGQSIPADAATPIRVDQTGRVFVLTSLHQSAAQQQGSLPLYGVAMIDPRQGSGVITDGLGSTHIVTGIGELDLVDLDHDGQTEISTTFSEASSNPLFYYRWNPERATYDLWKCAAIGAVAIPLTPIDQPPCPDYRTSYPLER
ncbi:MAG: afsK16 [Actinomycetia bacterium]|nr:afsK16 [Actinomycetes bacterium]